MKKETLKVLRIIVPGVIIFIFFLPLTQGDFDFSALISSLISLKGLLSPIVICGLGGLYNIINLRKWFVADSHLLIHDNIKSKLLSPFSDDHLIAGSSERLREGRNLLHVFYYFVDRDPSLKEKAKNIYFNGLLWSSTADIMALSCMFMASYLIGYLFLNRDHYLIGALVLGLLCLFASWALMPIVTKKHIALSDEQLDYIKLHYKEALHSKLLDLL